MTVIGQFLGGPGKTLSSRTGIVFSTANRNWELQLAQVGPAGRLPPEYPAQLNQFRQVSV